MRRGYLILTVGMAFFCGFVAANIIQAYVWNQGVKISIDFKVAAPTSPEQNPLPSASVPAPAQASPPQFQVSGIPGETRERKFQPEEKGTKQVPGFQDIGRVLPKVASLQKRVATPPSTATTQTPNDASRSDDVDSLSPRKEIQPTKEVVNLQLGPQAKADQAEVPDANNPQEIVAQGIKNFPTTSGDDVARENPVAGALPAQVVVQKGDSLGKIITQYYPGQEKLGLEATILANPAISREDVIHPGQTLNLPRINVSAQAVQLQDQQFYALYGSYDSTVSWAGDKHWLEKDQVRFIVRKTQESTGRVVHRVFLGSYETVSDLVEVQRRLLTRGKRAWRGKDSNRPVVSGSTAGQEDISDGAAPAEGGRRSPNPAPAGESQPNPVSPSSTAAPEVKGVTGTEAREMVADQSPLELQSEGDHPQALLKCFISYMKLTAAVEWITCRGRNVLDFWRYLISLAGSRQNIPLGSFFSAVNTRGQETLMKVRPETVPPENAVPRRPEPCLEGGFTLSPSPMGALYDQGGTLSDAPLSRYQEILGVLLLNKISHFPEHLFHPVLSRETWQGKTGFWESNGEFQKNVEEAGSKASKPWEEPEEQEPLMPLPEPDSPEKALPPGTIRRYWDANGVLHIVNGEIHEPNLETAGIPVEGLKQAQPSERETPEKPLPVRNVSWPGQDSNPMLPAGLNGMEMALPPFAEGSIRGYLDAKLRLHIVNAEPKDPIPATENSWAENLEKGNEGANRLGKNVSFPIEEQLPPSPLKGSAGKALPAVGEGTIRRYRDSKGALHIETVEYPKPEPVAAQMLVGTPKTRTVADASPLVSPLSVNEGQGLPRQTNSEVVAFRDRTGRLIIRNREMETKGPRVARWEEVMAQLTPIIQEASLLHELPVPLIQALIKVESNFYCWAVSPKGAMGLMQLMPETAASLGVKDPFNPRENIHGGCRYLRLMLDSFKGSLPLALAAYNAGPQRVVSCGFQVPPIKETQGFVTEVLGRYLATQKNTRTDASVKNGHLMPVAAVFPK